MNDGKRVAVVTGASSGIGKALSKALVAQGWCVIGTGRDAGRMASATAEIDATAQGGQIEMLPADLSLLAGANELADAIVARADRLDLLVNNAGCMTDKLEMTAEGLERNYAGNHLGPFVLTERLLPLLRKTADCRPEGSVRILMTSSDASEMVPTIDLDDLQNLKKFDPGRAYCSGKLANVLHVRGLAERLKGTGIVAHAMHPGPVETNFDAHAAKQTREYMQTLDRFNEAEGADTLFWLATSEEGGQSSGGYWDKRKPRKPHPLADDPNFVERFWQASCKLVDQVIATR